MELEQFGLVPYIKIPFGGPCDKMCGGYIVHIDAIEYAGISSDELTFIPPGPFATDEEAKAAVVEFANKWCYNLTWVTTARWF